MNPASGPAGNKATTIASLAGPLPLPANGPPPSRVPGRGTPPGTVSRTPARARISGPATGWMHGYDHHASPMRRGNHYAR